ncbi:MAG: glutamate--cysteine ligase, partial [Endozoicomonas sp.]
HRYGKPMQTIAGIHYNFSLPEEFWELMPPEEDIEEKDRISAGYFGMIRNFHRYSWLLMYLFGASPVVHRSFFVDGGKKSGLEALDSESLYLPYATSLRMSDMGYSNDAQSSLNICYNTIDEYVNCLTKAIQTPYAPYEALGLKQGDKYLQLSTNMLQIENEYYSTIRPKRVTRSGEKPITALRNKGVEYVEVRCMDINPFEPLGLSKQDAYFLDVFLLYCALQPSEPVLEAECMEIANNLKKVVLEGRRPGLGLHVAGREILMQKLGEQLIEDMSPIAQLLDEVNGGSLFVNSTNAQQEKLKDVSLTPSAKVLKSLQSGNIGYLDFMLSLSKKHAETLYSEKLTAECTAYLKQVVEQSIEDQSIKEKNENHSFDEFLQDYMRSEF